MVLVFMEREAQRGKRTLKFNSVPYSVGAHQCLTHVISAAPLTCVGILVPHVYASALVPHGAGSWTLASVIIFRKRF